MADFKFELGSEVKDKVTGFKGIIKGRSQYLSGCNTYGIQSQKLKENKPQDWIWIDEDYLTLIKNKKITLKDEKDFIQKGGPNSKSEFPSQRN